ncbi:hypothetical protein QTP88_002973 [Uroleucon formosanum]
MRQQQISTGEKRPGAAVALGVSTLLTAEDRPGLRVGICTSSAIIAVPTPKCLKWFFTMSFFFQIKKVRVHVAAEDDDDDDDDGDCMIIVTSGRVDNNITEKGSNIMQYFCDSNPTILPECTIK